MTTDGMSFSLWVFLGVLAIQIFDVAAEEVGGSCASVGSEGNCVVSREDSIPNAEKPTCNLYLAESTIPGAGLGIFTGIDLDVDDWVGYEDVLLPLVDMAYHQRAWYSKNVREKKYATDPTADYAWSARYSGYSRNRRTARYRRSGPVWTRRLTATWRWSICGPTRPSRLTTWRVYIVPRIPVPEPLPRIARVRSLSIIVSPRVENFSLITVTSGSWVVLWVSSPFPKITRWRKV